jgi:hypothetical protein
MKIKVSTLAIIALPLAACVGNTQPPTGQPALGSASDLSAFQGARAGQAEMGIQNLGYELIRTQGLTQYWFNRSTGACAELKVGDGRYQSVRMLPADDC